MGLQKYTKKRKFDTTPEPEGIRKSSQGHLVFVVQKHHASQLHYDFRLEMEGVLKSWAVPKGPSLDPKVKRMAMMVEDHPFDYRNFEGRIPKGNYGAGTVIVWDQGTYGHYDDGPTQEQEKKLLKGLKEGHITFILHGKKLKGEFALVRMKNARQSNAWLLIKAGKDTHATSDDVTKQDESVQSGKSLDELENETEDPPEKTVLLKKKKIKLEGASRGPMPHKVKPMLATLVAEPFDQEGWEFEVKWDGYRVIAEVSKKKVEMYSRNHIDFTETYAPISKELKRLPYETVLDGEVVVLDEKGRGSFQLLQQYHKTGVGNLLYYVFDILYLDGHDLRELPLKERQRILKEVVQDMSLVKFSEGIHEKGESFFMAAQKQGLEGIIAKDENSPYRQGLRTKEWLKIKTHLRQEAVIGGYTEPRGGRKHFGALVLGVYEDGKLKYIGHTGGGFDQKKLKDIYAKLQKLRQTKSPFENPPKTNAPVTWVRPKLVAEVEFREWTSDGHMRQPIFIGLREDKYPKDIKRELPLMSTKADTKKNSNDQEMVIDGHKLQITNMDKVFWPKEKYTKGDVVEYYRKISKIIVPYLKDRPENLNRHPNGITGDSFYQKDVDHQPPSWVKTVPIYSESNKKHIRYLVCQNEATLLYMANLGCIEINPWNSRIKKINNPDFAIMDLDPEGIGFNAVIEAAQVIHEILEKSKIPNFCKTSGATGLHICIPLGAKYDYDQAKDFVHILGMLAHDKLPKTTSLERSPAKRKRKIYLDYLQNRRGQTLASVYCLRPKPGAPVSTPLEWDEVKPGLEPTDFNIKTIFERLDKKGDIWKPLLGKGIDLLKAIEQLSKAR
jgi:bifunctional non-homologous end joining protein LigD